MESPAPAPADPDAPDTPATPAPQDGTVAAPDGTVAAPDTPAAPEFTGPVWRFLIQPRWIAWHLFVVVSFWGMLWMGDWQLHRALAGNGLSWAYTFEWPLFSGFAAVFWVRTIRDEFRLRRGSDGTEAAGDAAATGPALPEGLGTRQIERPADDAGDAELASYNAYLARLNAEVKSHGKWRGFR